MNKWTVFSPLKRSSPVTFLITAIFNLNYAHYWQTTNLMVRQLSQQVDNKSLWCAISIEKNMSQKCQNIRAIRYWKITDWQKLRFTILSMTVEALNACLQAGDSQYQFSVCSGKKLCFTLINNWKCQHSFQAGIGELSGPVLSWLYATWPVLFLFVCSTVYSTS